MAGLRGCSSAPASSEGCEATNGDHRIPKNIPASLVNRQCPPPAEPASSHTPRCLPTLICNIYTIWNQRRVFFPLFHSSAWIFQVIVPSKNKRGTWHQRNGLQACHSGQRSPLSLLSAAEHAKFGFLQVTSVCDQSSYGTRHNPALRSDSQPELPPPSSSSKVSLAIILCWHCWPLQAISHDLWDWIYIKWILASSFLSLLAVFLACTLRGEWWNTAWQPSCRLQGFHGSSNSHNQEKETCTSATTWMARCLVLRGLLCPYTEGCLGSGQNFVLLGCLSKMKSILFDRHADQDK